MHCPVEHEAGHVYQSSAWADCREQIQAQERVQAKTKECIRCCDAMLVTLGEAIALKNRTGARTVHESKDSDTEMADASGMTSLQSFKATLLRH
eukprot:1136735-Pelagomonas_calceolata.AAC.3